MVLTDKGHVFGIGANSCGQLGQYYNEMKPSDAEEIFLAKTNTDIAAQSFGTILETSSLNSNDDGSSEIENKSEQEKYDANASEEEAIKMLDGSVNHGAIPQMNIFEEKQKESVSLTPKLIKSLMHRKVLKISSGGVHNICIVEPYPNHLSADLYSFFMKSKYTDVCFVLNDKSGSFREGLSEEEKSLDNEENRVEYQILPRSKTKARKQSFEHKIYGHKFLL